MVDVRQLETAVWAIVDGHGTEADDVLLGADNVHPTAAGSMALGQYEASAIRSILAAL